MWSFSILVQNHIYIDLVRKLNVKITLLNNLQKIIRINKLGSYIFQKAD